MIRNLELLQIRGENTLKQGRVFYTIKKMSEEKGQKEYNDPNDNKEWINTEMKVTISNDDKKACSVHVY